MGRKWLLNLFFCVGLGKHFETLFVQLMLVIYSERNEGFLLAPAVPCPAGQAGLFSSPSASRCWLLSGENRSLARTVCLLSSLSSGSGVMLIYRVRPVACSSCLPLGESRSNFLSARLWCGRDSVKSLPAPGEGCVLGAMASPDLLCWKAAWRK